MPTTRIGYPSAAGGGAATLTVKVTVANQTARYALTTAEVQAGDYVYQTDTATLYEVIDATALSSSAGYAEQPALATSGTPAMDGTAARGTSVVAARADHVHPSDTSRAASTHTHAATDIADGSVSNAEFQALDGVTSAIQTQLNNIRQAGAGANSAAEILSDAYTVLASDRGTAVTYLTAAVLKAVSRDGLGAFLAALTGKTTPVGADGFVISDSAAAGVEKFLTLTNLVAALKTLIATDTLAAPTDVTTNNATTSAHGLLKKLSNVATQYMDGTGAWSVPASAITAEGCSLYLTSDDTMSSGWTNGTWKQVTGGWTERTDVGGYSAAGAEPTVPTGRGGKFWAIFSAVVAWGGSYGMLAQVRVGGNAVTGLPIVQAAGASGQYATLTVMCQLTLAAGDVVSGWLQPSGANDAGTLLGNSTNGRTTLELWRIGD